MDKLFKTITEAFDAGREFALCSIIASSGSTPRSSGAKMAVFADGSTEGTVGGGAVEFESIKKAREALASKSAFTVGYDLSPNKVADIGMICGGSVVVYFQYFSGSDKHSAELFKYALGLMERGDVDSWLITRVSSDGVCDMGIYEAGKGLMFAKSVTEAEIRPMLTAKPVLSSGEPGYYVEPLTQSGIVYVFGGGHVSQELVPMIAHVGFKPVVYEDRDAFATPELFPDAVKLVVAPFTEVTKHVTINPSDYVVVMTRGHEADFEVQEQMLRTRACYVGVIGSRHKKAATIARLKAVGIPDEDIARIHNPIGVAIKAETPAEIAVSVTGELILVRAELKLGETE